LVLANVNVRLALWSGSNFTGRRILIRRGGIAIKDLGAFRFNNLLTSFSLRNTVNPSQVTLVLFSGLNFTGNFRVFRGSQSVANLSTRNFNNVTTSLILVGRNLTNTQINRIRNTGNPPGDVVIIRQ
jgi:hypothetical protein